MRKMHELPYKLKDSFIIITFLLPQEKYTMWEETIVWDTQILVYEQSYQNDSWLSEIEKIKTKDSGLLYKQ